jgi:hypothetical protein
MTVLPRDNLISEGEVTVSQHDNSILELIFNGMSNSREFRDVELEMDFLLLPCFEVYKTNMLAFNLPDCLSSCRWSSCNLNFQRCIPNRNLPH